VLFQLDLTGASPADVFEHFWDGQDVAEETRSFSEALVLGVCRTQDETDLKIAEAAEHWRLDRMAVVDRNVLRMAVYEMLHLPDTPDAVVIDEAIEVARKFGSEDSAKFINGILDSILRRSRTPPTEEG
jgi:N utilization substance protein B